MYVSETWGLTERSVQELGILERKILREIFRSTKELNGLWIINTNEQMDGLI
jgi:hypothetical protein